MARMTATIKMDAKTVLTLNGFARDLWEARWLALTGAAWADTVGRPKIAALDVALVAGKPFLTRVRIRGTALEIAASKVEMVTTPDSQTVLRIEVPMYADTARIDTNP